MRVRTPDRPAAPPAADATARTLGSTWDPARNGMSLLRLGLAVAVAVAHGLALSEGWQPVLGAGTELGEMAVDGFFVLSGFLVAGSLLRLGSIRRYAWHRFLRIMPGFWVCLVVTAFVVVPLVVLLRGGDPATVLRGEDSSTTFLVRNALLLIRQYDVDAVPVGITGEQVVNGALWTLCYEAVCYGLVVGLGVLGLLARRRALTLALVVVLQALVVLQATGVAVVPQERMLRLALMFLLGVCALLFADRIRLSVPLAVAAAALVGAGVVLLPDYRAVGAVGLAYLVLAASAQARLAWTPRWDLSYGLYVYHWPLALLLLAGGAGALTGPAFIALLLVVAGAVATGSWLAVEAPAMRLRRAAWVTAPPPDPRRVARRAMRRLRSPILGSDPGGS